MASSLEMKAPEPMAGLGQLSAGIVHDVKNYMTGIIGFAQIGLKRADDAEKARELFGLIEADAVRCKEMLVRFLKVARVGERKTKVIDINAVVQEGIQSLAPHLALQNIRLELTLGAGVPPVLGVAAEIQQVLANLASNALQAMPQGGEIRIRTSRDSSDCAEILFSDNGPGIPEAIIPRVFEPFFTTKADHEGTGLGLTICREIVRLHNGSISVASQVGSGSTFTVRLPSLAPVQQPTALTSQDGEQKHVSRE